MTREFAVAPWPSLLWIVSVGATLLMLAVSFVAWTQIPRVGAAYVVGTLVAWAPLLVIPVAALFVVNGYELTERELRIQRLFWATVLPLAGITAVTREPNLLQGSRRTFGNGGLYSFTGTFSRRDIGRYRAYVTDWSRCVLLSVGGRKIAVSPADPDAFIKALRQAFPQLPAEDPRRR